MVYSPQWQGPSNAGYVGISAIALFNLSSTASTASQHNELPNISKLDLSDVFEHAKEEHLHGQPDIFEPDDPSLRKKVAYMVFRGWKMGIFKTWYAFHLFILFSPQVIFMCRPAAAMQTENLPGGKTGWLQGYYSHDATVKAWEHALANNLVSIVEDVMPSRPPPSPPKCSHGPWSIKHQPPTPISDDEDMYLSDELPISLPSVSVSSKHPALHELAFQPSPSWTPLSKITSSAQPSLSSRKEHSLTMLSSQMEMTDKECYWVVEQGAKPGVYERWYVLQTFVTCLLTPLHDLLEQLQNLLSVTTQTPWSFGQLA